MNKHFSLRRTVRSFHRVGSYSDNLYRPVIRYQGVGGATLFEGIRPLPLREAISESHRLQTLFNEGQRS